MSVTEIGVMHTRYVRLSDRFKAIWTYHQFAAGVFKNFLEEALPYNIDFQKMYEKIKKISGTLNAAQLADAVSGVSLAELQLERASSTLLAADDRIQPSIARRFFEKLKRQTYIEVMQKEPPDQIMKLAQPEHGGGGGEGEK